MRKEHSSFLLRHGESPLQSHKQKFRSYKLSPSSAMRIKSYRLITLFIKEEAVPHRPLNQNSKMAFILIKDLTIFIFSFVPSYLFKRTSIRFESQFSLSQTLSKLFFVKQGRVYVHRCKKIYNNQQDQIKLWRVLFDCVMPVHSPKENQYILAFYHLVALQLFINYIFPKGPQQDSKVSLVYHKRFLSSYMQNRGEFVFKDVKKYIIINKAKLNFGEFYSIL